eukprot:TRINITY_DN2297_c0_g1_i2.p1 TRINITY_DN2297_c0_g1~~TRINITY_DN2297_c0_g1_i2.p1  ORF type:complete len:293 (+),score=49.58 TRINITY_DN2297_c0_g1_i2:119-997(+)
MHGCRLHLKGGQCIAGQMTSIRTKASFHLLTNPTPMRKCTAEIGRTSMPIHPTLLLLLPLPFPPLPMITHRHHHHHRRCRRRISLLIRISQPRSHTFLPLRLLIQRASLLALDTAFDLLDEYQKQTGTKDLPPVRIMTDSKYAEGMLQKGWKAKSNQQLITSIRSRLRQYSDVNISWVAGHSGIKGNERADELANQGAKESSSSGNKRRHDYVANDETETTTSTSSSETKEAKEEEEEPSYSSRSQRLRYDVATSLSSSSSSLSSSVDFVVSLPCVITVTTSSSLSSNSSDS